MLIYLKSQEQIEGFKEIGRITGQILKVILDNCQEGNTTKELNRLAINECHRHKVRPAFLNFDGFPGAICASNNEVLVHGVPNDDLLKNGDFISIDFGAERNGFIGDSAETICIGEENQDILNGRNILKEAIKKAIPGNSIFDISKTVQDFAEKYQYGYPLHFGGHGICMGKLHSEPYIPNYIPKDIDEENLDLFPGLYPGMIIAIEPMFILGGGHKVEKSEDGWSIIAQSNTTHHEHTILITEEEPFVLTKRN